MDTVSILGMDIPPFEPRIEKNRLWGRGSCDTKAGLAAMLYALKTVSAVGPPSCTIMLAATVDEEYAFRGVSHLIDSGIKADAAVVSEPTGLDVVIAHKGCLRWRILTRGKAAHSSKVHLGLNAISKMAGVIQAIDTRLVPTYSRKCHPLLGTATLNIGMIEGGIQVNTVPDRCAIEVDRRMLPGESKDSVWAEFAEVLSGLRDADPALQVEMEEPKLYSVPLETDEREHVVRVAQEACRETTGRGITAGVPYGTDASKLSRVGIPSIVLGPGNIDQAHSSVEFVDLDQVTQAAEIYARMMLSF
jgi:acetylornithine deacetylase